MSENPLVSVILPTHNRVQLLGRAIYSVLNQTFTGLELIVVDDGSTDSTQEFLHSIADPRLRIVTLESRKGATAARNVGISSAKGAFIAFQDSDDEWFPEKLASQLEVFEKSTPHVDVVACGFWRQNGEMREYIPGKRFKNLEGNVYASLIWENFIGTPSLLVNRKCFDRAGFFDERIPRFQDWEICLRFSQCCQFGFVHAPLYIAHRQGLSISNDNTAGLDGLQIIFNKNRDAICADHRLHAHFQHWLGVCFMSVGNVREGRKHFRRAIAIHPSTIKYYCAYLLSWAGTQCFNQIIKNYLKVANKG